MALIEGNVLHVNNEKVTIEWQPVSDQAWQFYANNALTQSAAYPSMFANVHKSQLTLIGGSIGPNKDDIRQPPTMETRQEEVRKIEEFSASLKKGLSDAQKNERKLKFMAENGIRQLGYPRIGIFADRQRPESMHLEINNWQHVLNIIYIESIRRNKFKEFVAVLKAPVQIPENEMLRCGLKFIGRKIEDHYNIRSV